MSAHQPVSVRRKAVYGGLSTLVGGAIAIAALEIAGPTILADRPSIVYDVDHRMRPGLDPDLNSDGIRSPLAPEEFGVEGFNVIVLGDSFVYGSGLSSSESVPAQFERIARRELGRDDIRVANLGWVSSSPLLSLRLLRDIGRKYHPRLVLLAIDMTDVADDIRYRLLLGRRGVYRLLDYVPITFFSLRKLISLIPALDGVHERVFGFPARRFFITERPLAETRHRFADIQDSIDKIFRHTTHELDAKFVLFVLPRAYQYSDREVPLNWEAGEYELLGPYGEEPFRYFEELRRRAPYPVYSLLDDFKKTEVFPTAFEDDPHWNADGARVAAEAIYRYCLQASCFK